MQYNAKKLREQIGELVARCQAILDTGDLTDDLRAELDRIQGKGDEGKEGFVAGELQKLQADLKRVEAIEKRTLELAKTQTGTAGKVQQGDDRGDEGDRSDEAETLKTPFARCEKLTIPIRQQFRYGTLKAFKGKDAERQAYLAGRFFIGALLKDEDCIRWCRDHGINMTFRAALGENQNQLGGVLVPDEVEQTVIDLRESRGVARQECMVTAMASDTKFVPRRTGGLTSYFVDENPSSGITESDKNWDSVRLVARTLATLTRYSIQLSDDAIISIGDDLASEIAYAFADKEDRCLFLGDGTSTYGGIYGVPAIAAGSVYTAASGNTAFSTLDLADFEGMVGKLPQYAEANAKWYISKAGWAASMLRLIDAGGGNTWRDLANGKRELQFLGYPVVIVQVMNSTLTAQVNATNVALFGDMRQAATFGNRRGVSVFPSEHRYMEFNQIGIRGMERFDINFHERGDASNAGSMISLTLPGS
jgi:HK97 family phage major capsid protein